MTLTRLASQPEFLMPSVSWIVLGSIAGVVAAIAGGWLIRLFGMAQVTRLNLHGAGGANLVAVVLLIAYRTTFHLPRHGSA